MQMQPSSAHAYIRSGQIPFFRLPCADLAAEARARAEVDAVILGVPWDGSVTYQPGARFAPYEVRRVSALVQPFHPRHRIDVFQALRTVDGGNVAVPPFDPRGARQAIQGEVERILALGARPFVVGGDHSVALPVMRALAARHGPLALVHIDAHADTSTSLIWGESIHHGTVIRNACDEGLVARGMLFQIGVRAPWGDRGDGDFARDQQAVVYAIDDVHDAGVGAIARAIVTAIGDRPTYLSLDIDGIDPAFAPGTGTPVPGGLTASEALRLLRSLAGLRLVGMDVVEICPALDHADITVHLGAALLYEGLALAALDRRARTP
ncbi:MAG: agmatinase [Nannocystaceae bacterium]